MKVLPSFRNFLVEKEKIKETMLLKRTKVEPPKYLKNHKSSSKSHG